MEDRISEWDRSWNMSSSRTFEEGRKAGIREVVEYVESCILVENIWEGDDWRAKKKEWGV